MKADGSKTGNTEKLSQDLNLTKKVKTYFFVGVCNLMPRITIPN